MITVRDLRKTYGELNAVDGLSFTATEGRIFGLLGPNGAGKSTTIGCISGLVQPTSGHVEVSGLDVATHGPESRKRLGIVPQELALYEDLSAEENVRFWAGAYGLRGRPLADRTRTVLERAGLSDRAREPVKRFSGGMKRRLNFACGVAHEPRVLLLDEPTVGVDPQSRVRLLELVREEAKNGVCVLYTTHYMEEAESLCDELAIVDHGKLIASGTVDELRLGVQERDLLRLTGAFDPARITHAIDGLDGVEVVQVEPELLTLATAEAPQKLSRILSALAAAGADIRETTLNRPSLETLFIKLTGKELRE